MKAGLVAFGCGIIFTLGLGVSGMTQAGKVTAFLDFTGKWDASLLFVMMGAILVYSIGYRLVIKKTKPLLADRFILPTPGEIDRPLILGSATFGVGWGLAGYCPGPALASIASLRKEPLLFVSAMFLGMAIFELSQRRKKTS